MLRQTAFGAAALAAACVISALPASAATVIKPDAATSKDTFVYSFLPAFNFNSGGFSSVLASGLTTSNHNLRTLVQFDLTGISMQPGDIATLNLFVSDAVGLGFPGVANPTTTDPVTIDAFPITAAWDANLVSWNAQPTFGSAVDDVLVDGVGRYFTFDVTSQVQTWLNDPSSNFGFSLQQRTVVPTPAGSAVALYHSSANANRPFLYVGVVPEPGAILGLAAAGGMLTLRRRR